MTELNQSSYVILGVLSKYSLSGYGLKQIAAKVTRFIWSESNAQIYPILKKLEQQKLVCSKLDESSGARQKRIYKITASGRKVLVDWLQQPVVSTSYREEFLLKLSYGQNLPAEKIKQQLKEYQLQIEDKLEQYERVIEHIRVDHADRKDQPYLLMVYDHVKMVLDAKHAWAIKMQKKTKSLK